MKKYLNLAIGAVFVAVTIILLITSNKYKEKYIDCMENSSPQIEYVTVHDTVSVEKPVVKWKTKHDTAEYVIRDTFYTDSIVFITNTIECPLDTFYATERVLDDNINATIHIEGRGVYEKTFIDSVSMEYEFIQEQIAPNKKCCWLKRILFGCD